MTSTVVKFEPRGTVEPVTRISDFIQLARHELSALIPSDDWDLPSWNVNSSFVTKGRNRLRRTMHYYRLGMRANRDGTAIGTAFDVPFTDFAKAYCRYLHATSPVQFENQAKRLNALQFIEAAFRSLELEPHIADCNPTVLNTAVLLAKDGVGAARHYQFASYIEQVHRFCLEHRFYNAPFQWRHGVRKPKDKTEELGESARRWREERLPSPEAYSALAHVFRNAETFIDKLMSAVSAICCSVPIRAHEVLQLRVQCEVREKRTIKKVDPDGSGSEEAGVAYGLEVFPGKGELPQVKWVPSLMVSTVEEAVERLTTLCSPGRVLSAWYEANPGKLWLPPHLEHLRAFDWISTPELCEILGLGPNSAYNWLSGNSDVRRTSKGAGGVKVNFEDVQRVLLALTPRNFPNFNGDADQKYSETLIVLRRNEAHAQRGTIPCVVGGCGVQTFQHWLSGHDDGKKPSVFERWGFKERDGSAIAITTHSFRHWLNTVAQLRGMSDLDIAKWSGRDPSQNKAYNHVTPEETLSQVRELLEEHGGVGPMFEAAKPIRINRPVSPQDFLMAQSGAAHVTDFGICIHDYSLLPCQVLGDCLGCSENIFEKGDIKHRDKIESRLAIALVQLEHSGRAETEAIYGADRWTQDHLRKIAKMRAILAIQQDDSIPDGTLINLDAAGQDNEVAMAVRDRKANLGRDVAAPPDADLRAAFDVMWDD